jgi:hypothetical protein
MSTSQTDLGLAASPSLKPVLEDDDDDDLSSHFSEKDIETAKQRAAKMERKQLAAMETKIVFWLRILCCAILMSTAVVVSLGVYFYTKNDEEEDFKHVYDASSAERVIQSFHDSVSHLLAGVDAFSVAVTSYALNAGATFPNVTVPDPELRGASTRVITKSIASIWLPLVHEEDRAGWEAYATQTHTHQMRSFQVENGYILRQDEVFELESNVMMPPTGGAAGQQPPGESGSMESPNGQASQMNQQQQASQQEATQPG